MKAIVCREYGPPEVLRCEEIDAPTAKPGEVLVRVHAASVNPVDWHFMRGSPLMLRAMVGWSRPKDTRVGVDLAGTVEAVGAKVIDFKPGDEVFGVSRGACAEYVCVGEGTLALKPANVTFEQAAAVPLAGMTALQGLRDRGRMQPGQTVLINGASGGVGTLAVQIAKSFGADVTAVCSARNIELVRSIGADQVIDYTREDFTRGGRRFDLILDNVGNHSLADCRCALTARGALVLVGGGGVSDSEGRWIGPLARSLQAALLSPFVSQKLGLFVASSNQGDLVVLKELMEARKLTPVIDRTYPLREVPDAIRYLEQGHARGKVVIAVAP